MIYGLHDISQVGADVWYEMYNGVHGNGRMPDSIFDPEYFCFTPSVEDCLWRDTSILDEFGDLKTEIKRRLPDPRHHRIWEHNSADAAVKLLQEVNYKHRDDFEPEIRPEVRPKLEMMPPPKTVEVRVNRNHKNLSLKEKRQLRLSGLVWDNDNECFVEP